MDHELHHPRAFFGRRKGHKLRKRQAELFDTLLPVLALDLSQPAPAELPALFPVPVDEVQIEIGFGGGENMIAQAAARQAAERAMADERFEADDCVVAPVVRFAELPEVQASGE